MYYKDFNNIFSIIVLKKSLMFSMACFKIKLELFFLAIKDSAKCKNTLSQGSFSDIYSE